MTLVEDAAALQEGLVALRHSIHREPELGLELPKTQAKVLAALEGLPLEITLGRECTSITAVLRGGRSGPNVLLRGDMDALPLTETVPLVYASQIDGVMHACGHDMNTVILVGAAKLLAARREDLAGSVIFMFQPGEEGFFGARLMIEEGLLDAAGDPPVAAYGLHVYSGLLPCGTFGTRSGSFTSASAAMYVDVHGTGGHASRPHLSKDPVPAACEMVLALQSAVTRNFDVFDPVVLTVGVIAAGTKRNIIPDHVRIEATVRSYSAEARDRVEEVARAVCEGVAAAHGLRVTIDYQKEYPPMIASMDAAQAVADSVRRYFGPDRFQEIKNPMSGSEDFAFVLEQVPGTFVVLGAAPPDTDLATAPTNHSAQVHFDDRVLADGAALHASLALGHLTDA